MKKCERGVSAIFPIVPRNVGESPYSSERRVSATFPTDVGESQCSSKRRVSAIFPTDVECSTERDTRSFLEHQRDREGRSELCTR